MSSFTYGYDKQYKCLVCNEFYHDSDILAANSWKCPKCGEYIRIAAPDLKDGHVLIRKPASELKKFDSVHTHGQFVYNVISITTQGENEVCVALKNYGLKIFNPSEFVSVIDGGYYEENWKEDLSEPCQE